MKTADIPSDAESVDRLVDSDIEENEMNMQVGDEDAEEDASDSDVNEDDGKCSGGVWMKDGKQRADSPFTADFGPNIPDNIKNPLDIF